MDLSVKEANRHCGPRVLDNKLDENSYIIILHGFVCGKQKTESLFNLVQKMCQLTT